MRKICAKLVSKDLSVVQKANRVKICQDLLERLEMEHNFLDKVITGDESWVFEYDPETKRQSAECHTKNSPRPKKARMSKSKVKTLIMVFFDCRGTRNLYLQDRQLIMSFTKMSRNDFENEFSETERT